MEGRAVSQKGEIPEGNRAEQRTHADDNEREAAQGQVELRVLLEREHAPAEACEDRHA
jgi:hypothetical protein